VGGAIVALPALTNALGNASLRLPIPTDPALRGVVRIAQAAVADPLGPVAGLALSAGRALRVGD
jgi:hypothetical protein